MATLWEQGWKTRKKVFARNRRKKPPRNAADWQKNDLIGMVRVEMSNFLLVARRKLLGLTCDGQAMWWN